jgi:nucleotidyltransferase substrate binding protein (TIGR01987 family)
MSYTHLKYTSLARQTDNLTQAINMTTSCDRPDMIPNMKESVIQRFEYCIESSRKFMKKFLGEKYGIETIGPKDTIKEAHLAHIIDDTQVWMNMLQSRNQTSHIYDEETANDIYNDITVSYSPAMQAFIDSIDPNAL